MLSFIAVWLPLTYFAVRTRPALHAALVSKLVAHVVAEVVVARTTNFVALAAVVVLIAANTHGVVEAGHRAFMHHHLLLLPRVEHPFIGAALDQQLVIWTNKQDTEIRCQAGWFHYCVSHCMPVMILKALLSTIKQWSGDIERGEDKATKKRLADPPSITYTRCSKTRSAMIGQSLFRGKGKWCFNKVTEEENTQQVKNLGQRDRKILNDIPGNSTDSGSALRLNNRC